jgi:hypothetical protein
LIQRKYSDSVPVADMGASSIGVDVNRGT